jgi:hypothetical protein
VSPGLAYLLRASWRGFFRRAGRRMRTVRGLLATIFGLLFFVILVGTQVMALLVGGGAEMADRGGTVLVYSLVMMLLLVPSLVAADAPFFWPQEVQFLFPAPLERSELLLYQMLRSGWVQAFSGMWLGLMSMRSAPHPPAALAAAVLAMLFIFTATQWVGLLKLAVGDRLPGPARAAVKPLLGILALAAAFAFYRRTQAVGFGDAVGEAFASTWIRVATLPARPFGELFAARSLDEGLAWAGLCIVLIVGSGAAVTASRVDFRERSLVSSAKRFERLRRMRSARSGYASAGAPVRRRIPVPAFALLGRAAPIARRQVYELGRGLRTLWGLLFTAALAFFYVIVMPGWMNDGPARPDALGVTLVVLVIVFPMLASSSFSIDFRRDLERMAYLRSLPLPPMAVAVGQVFTAAVIIAVLNAVLLLMAAALAEWRVERPLMIAAAAGAVPVAWLAVTLENWIFLLFPTRTQADGGQQNAFMGKQFVKLLFKSVVLGVVAGVAGIVAVGGAWLAGTWGAAAGVVLIVLLACAGATALLAHAYRRFDLTVDSPA